MADDFEKFKLIYNKDVFFWGDISRKWLAALVVFGWNQPKYLVDGFDMEKMSIATYVDRYLLWINTEMGSAVDLL